MLLTTGTLRRVHLSFKFFKFLYSSLIEESVLKSPSELNAMVKSLEECMQYVIKRLIMEGKSAEIKGLLLDQVLLILYPQHAVIIFNFSLSVPLWQFFSNKSDNA